MEQLHEFSEAGGFACRFASFLFLYQVLFEVVSGIASAHVEQMGFFANLRYYDPHGGFSSGFLLFFFVEQRF